MAELKPLSNEGIAGALDRAVHYRLLNEPRLAESICLDVIEIEPENQRALVTMLLARTDQFGRESGARVEDARGLLPALLGEYEREYYAGIICERWAKALITRNNPGSGSSAHGWLTEAMRHYERAETLSPAGDDDPILRWNTCVRLIRRHRLQSEREDDFRPLLE